MKVTMEQLPAFSNEAVSQGAAFWDSVRAWAMQRQENDARLDETHLRQAATCLDR